MTANQNHRPDGESVAKERRSQSPHAQRRLVAYTNDAALTHALEELARMGADVCVVNDIEALSSELLVSTDAIALLDTGALSAPVDGFVDAIATQFPDLRLIVAGHSLDQSLLATRIASQRVYRFLHKPASAQRLKLFVDAASRPSGPQDPQRIGVTQTLETLKDTTLRHMQLSLPTGSGGMPRNRLLAIAAAIVVALGIGLFLLLRSGDRPQSAATTPGKAVGVVGAAMPASADVESLIQRADQAFAAARYAATDGSSAAELYSQALALARTDERARIGVNRSIDFALREAESSLVAGRMDEVESRVAALTRISPGNPRIEFLVSQLGRERERLAADESRRNANESRQQRLQASLALVNDRLRRGALLEPARDSALFHLRAAEEIAPGDADLRVARDALIKALLAAADLQLQARQVAPARRLLDAAGNLGADSTALDKQRRSADQITTEQVATTATQAAPATSTTAATVRNEPAATSAATGTASAPAPATATNLLPAAPSAATGDPIVLATSLTKKRNVKAEYPIRALERGTSGWVELEFTVTRDGSVSDVAVTAAEPKDVFDSSAISAVRRWRYEPVLRDGQPVELRARVRVRYTAKEP